MKMKTISLAMTALVLVSGCSRGGTANNFSANNTVSNAVEPVGGNGASSADGVDAAFLTGRWGTDSTCAQAIEFRADGTVTPPEGSTYAIAGNVVTVSSPGQPPDPKTVTRTGENGMTVSGGGSTVTLTRCR